MHLRLTRALAIVALGVVLGLCWNALSGRGFALTSNVYVKEGDEEIAAPEAKTRLERGALFLDARGVMFYEMGHIPGALPLPQEDFDQAFAALEPKLRSTFDIVVYCSGYGCEASHIVAHKLAEKGIEAAILHDGWPAWEEAGYPTRKGSAP